MVDAFQSPAQIKPDQILEIIVRRRWLIVIPVCISLTFGLALTLTANKTYQASTLILVQQQSVPTDYVKSVVTSSINQRINTISQQILSRSNLEKIIDQFGLYEDQRNMYLEDKIDGMRRRVQVKIERARQGAEAFSIKFNGSDPQRVMRIANTLASFFMDENLKVREAQAVGTSEFLESELEKTRRRLEDRERKLSAYRAKYLGGLPDELETNLRTLDRLQQQMADKHSLLREAKNALSVVESQISDFTKQFQQAQQRSEAEPGQSDEFQMSENEEKLRLARQEYDGLMTVYTRKHPDVQKAAKRVAALEKLVEEEKAATEEEKAAMTEQGAPPEWQKNPVFRRLDAGRSQIQTDIWKIESDINAIESQMAVYQKRVEETPKRELELQSLKRDYANIRDVYNSLLDRKLEAELSVNMEKKQKGEQFRILDHARLPEKPITPNVKKYFMMSVALGFGVAAGIIFLLEFFDASIRRDEQIEDELGLTILATIPELSVKDDRTRKKIEILAFVCCSMYAVAFLGFFAVLNAKGLDRTINLIKVYLNY